MRTEIVDQIEEFLLDNGLDEVYGVLRTDEARYSGLTFCKARDLDGSIRVYGPKFILLEYRTRIGGLPAHDRAVFESVDDTLEFLRLAFVEYKADEAMDVPRRMENNYRGQYEE